MTKPEITAAELTKQMRVKMVEGDWLGVQYIKEAKDNMTTI